MKFRRNIKERKLFIVLTIICFVLSILFFVLFLFKIIDLEFLILSILASIINLCCFFSVNNDYVIFHDDRIQIVNNKHTLDIQMNQIINIKIPSNKIKQNYIIINCKERKYSISYSKSIYEYLILKNISFSLYDNYLKEINN